MTDLVSRRLESYESLIKPIGRGELVSEARTRTSATLAHSEPATTDRRLRILLVDASADDRAILRAHLSCTPHRLEEAEDTLPAIRKLKLGRYDLLLLDMHGSQFDAYSAVCKIRNWEKAQGLTHVPLIALIPSTFPQDKSPLSSGCDQQIAKPVSKTALLDAIKAWSKPIDPVALAELRGFDTPDEESLLKALIQQFLSDLGPRLTALKKAWDGGDGRKLQLTAHAIRGSCGHFGAYRMARLCGYLDHSESEMNPDSSEMITELENEAMHVSLALAAQLETINGAVTCTTPMLPMNARTNNR